MKNTHIMKTAIASAIKLIVVSTSMILSGMAIPFLIAIIISILSSQATLEDCVSSVAFILFSVIGTLCSMFYILEEIKDISDAQYSHR